MLWAVPAASNAPWDTGSVALIAQERVFAVDISGQSRLLDTLALTWSVRAPMATPRSNFALTTLPSGQVLATGGRASNVATGSTERYRPDIDSWSTSAPMLTARRAHLAIPLASGKVLVVGGWGDNNLATRSVELFDELTGSWLDRASTPWDVSTFTNDRGFALPDGRAIVVRNTGVGIYDPSTNVWIDASPPPTAASLPVLNFAATQLTDSRIVISSMGVYGPTNDAWTAIPVAPRAFTTAAGILGNRAVFSGGEQVPCSPSLFCQSNFAYEYSAATNQWTDLGNQLGTRVPDLTLNGTGGYFAGVSNSPANSYALSGVLYQRSSLSQLYFSDPLALPLVPSVGESYTVNIVYAGSSEILSRPLTGVLTVSDGTASCQMVVPATSCTLVTTVAGAKTLTVDYAGDDNFAPSSTTYTPRANVIVDRSASVYVQSTPSGIFDFGVLSTLSYAFPAGTSVTLNANPTGANTFTGWLGDCVGTAPCTFTMPTDRHVRVKAFVAPTANAPFNIDVDRDGTAIAATDGLLILRYLLAFPSSAINVGAVNPAGSPAGGSTVNYLAGIRPRLDVDGDGAVDALTDGLLILRYLAGFRGDTLIANCVGAKARRSTALDLETYLATLLP